MGRKQRASIPSPTRSASTDRLFRRCPPQIAPRDAKGLETLLQKSRRAWPACSKCDLLEGLEIERSPFSTAGSPQRRRFRG